MIIASIETFALRIPFKPGESSASSAWGDEALPAVDSVLVKVTTDEGPEGGRGFRVQGRTVHQAGDRGPHRAALHPDAMPLPSRL
jgi:hypothetical protein